VNAAPASLFSAREGFASKLSFLLDLLLNVSNNCLLDMILELKGRIVDGAVFSANSNFPF